MHFLILSNSFFYSKKGVDEILKITIEFESGEKYPLYFSILEALESPPSIDSEVQGESTDANAAAFLEIVVDARKGAVVGIDMKVRSLLPQEFCQYVQNVGLLNFL